MTTVVADVVGCVVIVDVAAAAEALSVVIVLVIDDGTVPLQPSPPPPPRLLLLPLLLPLLVPIIRTLLLPVLPLVNAVMLLTLLQVLLVLLFECVLLFELLPMPPLPPTTAPPRLLPLPTSPYPLTLLIVMWWSGRCVLVRLWAIDLLMLLLLPFAAAKLPMCPLSCAVALVVTVVAAGVDAGAFVVVVLLPDNAEMITQRIALKRHIRAYSYKQFEQTMMGAI